MIVKRLYSIYTYCLNKLCTTCSFYCISAVLDIYYIKIGIRDCKSAFSNDIQCATTCAQRFTVAVQSLKGHVQEALVRREKILDGFVAIGFPIEMI